MLLLQLLVPGVEGGLVQVRRHRSLGELGELTDDEGALGGVGAEGERLEGLDHGATAHSVFTTESLLMKSA